MPDVSPASSPEGHLPRAQEEESRSGLETLGFVLLVVLGVLLVLLQVNAAPQLSPIDEFQHIDYLAKASQGQFVRQGEVVGELAMRAESCRGIDADFMPPPCNSRQLDPAHFQELGINTAAGNPPLYYLLTGLSARVVHNVLAIDFVTAGRSVGVLWLLAAIIFTWLLLRECRIALGPRLVTIVLVIATPVTLNSVSTVTSDAVLVAGGAAVLWATLRWERGQCPGWLPVAIAALAQFGKVTAIVGTSVAAAYLVVTAWRGDATGRTTKAKRKLLGLAASLVATACVVTLTWGFVVAQTAQRPSEEIDMNRRFHVDSLQPSRLLSQVPSAVTPVQNPRLIAPLTNDAIRLTTSVTNWLFLGGLFGTLFFVKNGTRCQRLAIATLLVALCTGPTFVLIAYMVESVYIDIPARYGLAALPAIALLFAGALSKRLVLLGIAGFAGFMALSLLTGLISGLQ